MLSEDLRRMSLGYNSTGPQYQAGTLDIWPQLVLGVTVEKGLYNIPATKIKFHNHLFLRVCTCVFDKMWLQLVLPWRKVSS